MKVTVVTICFNEEKNIAKTVDSVLTQTISDFEYIICDAKSTDRTVEIAETYKKRFAEKGVFFEVNSQKDKGIYDGMNKGIEKAKGEYIFFLNAGDKFYSESVLEKVVEAINANNYPDVIYGDIATVERGMTTVLFADHTRLEERMSISHPGVFCKTEIMKETRFNIDYKIGADYHFVLGQFLKGRTFFKLSEVVSYFASDGLSSANVLKSIEEQEKIKSEYGVQTSPIKWKIFAYKTQLKFEIKKFIPQRLWEIWSEKVKGKEILETNSASVEERLNLKSFKGCEGVLIGDVIHYNVSNPIKNTQGVKFVFSIIKRAFVNHYNITVKGEPKTICLMSSYCSGRADHRKNFLKATNLVENSVVLCSGSTQYTLAYVFELLKIFNWNANLKLEIPAFGIRMLCLRIIFDAYLDYKFFEKIENKNSWKIENLVTFCDVHPIDSFFTQKFNLNNKTTITLQHGTFSISSDSWVYSKAKSDYLLSDSIHSSECAKKVGCKSHVISVGALQSIGEEFVEKTAQNNSEVFGVVMNSEMTPREDNIEMIATVQAYCKQFGKKLVLKYHPNNNPKDFEFVIDKTITEEYDKGKGIEEFLTEIGVIIVSDSTVFTTALAYNKPSFLFYRKGFDNERYLNSDEVKFTTAEELSVLVNKIGTNDFNNLMDRYKQYYLMPGSVKENYKKAFIELGINNF